MDAKYGIISCGTIVAPFETEAEVVAYRLEHSAEINAYHARQAAKTVPAVQDNQLTDLGKMILGTPVKQLVPTPAPEQVVVAQPEPVGEKTKPLTNWLLDTQTIRIMQATFA